MLPLPHVPRCAHCACPLSSSIIDDQPSVRQAVRPAQDSRMQPSHEAKHACRAAGASGQHRRARPTSQQPAQPVHPVRPGSAPRTWHQQPALPARAAGRACRRARRAQARGILRTALGARGRGRPRRPAPWQGCLPSLRHGQPTGPRTLAAMEAVSWRTPKARGRPARLSPLRCGRRQMRSRQPAAQGRPLEAVLQRLAMRPMQRARGHSTPARMRAAARQRRLQSRRTCLLRAASSPLPAGQAARASRRRHMLPQGQQSMRAQALLAASGPPLADTARASCQRHMLAMPPKATQM